MSDKITDYLTEAQILLQLAEEAAELSAAAAKMARKLDGANPTPKRLTDCWGELSEEIADVDVCLSAIELSEESTTLIEIIYEVKKARWLKRLQEKAGAENE